MFLEQGSIIQQGICQDSRFLEQIVTASGFLCHLTYVGREKENGSGERGLSLEEKEQIGDEPGD